MMRNSSRLRSPSFGLSIVAATLVTATFASEPAAQQRPSRRDSALAVHVLNRLTFGPRPGDVERVLDAGINSWIGRQLSADTALDESAFLALRGCELFIEPIQVAASRLTVREQFSMLDETGKMSSAGIAFGGVGVVSKDSAMKIRGSPALGLHLANGQLHTCRLTRAERSDWQLQEVMTDFWMNHFSIHGAILPVRGWYLEYDRGVVRPNALGKFRTLLGAVARSPAMLHYLDNAVNSADSTRRSLAPYEPLKPRATGPAAPVFQRPGLNENYARELLELHTMGVDGGYTQQDVIEVARALTGWSHQAAMPGADEITMLTAYFDVQSRGGGLIGPPPAFRFDPPRHDAEVKVVLGHTLAAGRGLEDGEEVLDILARHPATARFIARKLAVRFVSDSPPAALVERAAETFMRTDGDIREVLRTIFASDEFRSPAVHGVKVKSPLEFVLSMRRAFAAPIDTAAEMIDLLVFLHQPPSGRFSPDGWPETGPAWVSAGAMSTRIDIARRVALDSLPSIPLMSKREWNSVALLPFDEQLSAVVNAVFGGHATRDTRESLARLRPQNIEGLSTDERQKVLRDLITLALGSPQFQMR